MPIRALTAALALAALTGAAAAREQVPAEERIHPYAAELLEACDDPVVLDTIAKRFRQAEYGYWSSDLAIVGFANIRTTHFRDTGLDLIPRRHCRATVLLNNQRTSPVYYELTQDAGMVGRGFGVRYCVMAYDRQWAFAPECKMAKP